MGPKKHKKRDKLQTRTHIKNTAIQIIKRDGIEKLIMKNLEQESGKSRKLVYDYFGGLPGLLDRALALCDLWIPYRDKMVEITQQHGYDYGERLIPELLQRHLEKFSQDKLAQEVARMALREDPKGYIKGLSIKREEVGKQILSLCDKRFEGTDVDIAFVSALLLSGMESMVLRRETSQTPFCGIDLKNPEDFEKLHKTIGQIIGWAYEHAKKNE